MNAAKWEVRVDHTFDVLRSFGFAVLIGTVAAVLGGTFGAFYGYDVGNESWQRKVDIEDACMAGNNNACRVMEHRE